MTCTARERRHEKKKTAFHTGEILGEAITMILRMFRFILSHACPTTAKDFWIDTLLEDLRIRKIA